MVKLSAETRSYAERLFEYPDVVALGGERCRRALERSPIAIADLAAAVDPAVREEVAFDDTVITAVTNITSGYPCFLQEWGANSG